MSEVNKPAFVGVDISKSNLDICMRQKTLTVANSEAGIGKFIRFLNDHGTCQVICENTGGYEKRLTNELHKAKIAVSEINPRQIRDFAKSIGRLEKTDAIDAEILLTYGEKIAPRPDSPPTEAETVLSEFVTARSQLVDARTLELAQQEHLVNTSLIKLSKRRISLLEKQIEDLDKLIDKHIQSDDRLNTRAARISKIKGVGPATTASIMAFMPELGSISDKQASKLAGVAPINHDSGKMRGQRHIRGGRPRARKALYMAALVATRFNTILSSFYSRLIARGKSPKLAITAVMRKLIILMNRLLRNPDFILV